VDALVPRIGVAAAGPMLDALTKLQAAQGRRLLLDRLTRLGPDVGLAAATRLGDERWYVRRNMLKIIGDLDIPPPGFRAAEHYQHEDPRVRIEALRILLRDGAAREGALVRALNDPDERPVRMALAAALQGCPPTAVAAVAARALSGATQEVRVAAIRVLGAASPRAVIDTLLMLTAPRRTLLGRLKPPPKTPEYLAALGALQSFRDDVRARDVLAQAAKSRDPEVAAAATVPDAAARLTATYSTITGQ
jgi:HEAT repeat protein